MTARASGGLCQPARSPHRPLGGGGVCRVMVCQVLWMPRREARTRVGFAHPVALPLEKCLSARAAAMLLVGEPRLKPGQRPRGSSMPAAHHPWAPGPGGLMASQLHSIAGRASPITHGPEFVVVESSGLGPGHRGSLSDVYGCTGRESWGPGPRRGSCKSVVCGRALSPDPVQARESSPCSRRGPVQCPVREETLL